MKKEISLTKFGVNIRTVRIEDAKWILELRNSDHAKRYIGETSTKLSDQLNWLHQYFSRENDFYFIVEDVKRSKPVGTIALYDITSNGQAEWGRWILNPDSMLAPASAFLIYEFAFRKLNLNMTYTRTVSANLPVVSFHNNSGANTIAVDKEFVRIGNKEYGITKHVVRDFDVDKILNKLSKLAEFVASRS